MYGLVCLDVSRYRGRGAFPGGPTHHCAIHVTAEKRARVGELGDERRLPGDQGFCAHGAGGAGAGDLLTQVCVGDERGVVWLACLDMSDRLWGGGISRRANGAPAGSQKRVGVPGSETIQGGGGISRRAKHAPLP